MVRKSSECAVRNPCPDNDHSNDGRSSPLSIVLFLAVAPNANSNHGYVYSIYFDGARVRTLHTSIATAAGRKFVDAESSFNPTLSGAGNVEIAELVAPAGTGDSGRRWSLGASYIEFLIELQRPKQEILHCWLRYSELRHLANDKFGDGSVPAYRWKAHAKAVSDCVISKETPWTLASCSSDGLVKVWDLRCVDKGPRACYAGHTRPVFGFTNFCTGTCLTNTQCISTTNPSFNFFSRCSSILCIASMVPSSRSNKITQSHSITRCSWNGRMFVFSCAIHCYRGITAINTNVKRSFHY